MCAHLSTYLKGTHQYYLRLPAYANKLHTHTYRFIAHIINYKLNKI